MKTPRIGKTILTLALGMSLLSSGALMIGTHAAHASAVTTSPSSLANHIIASGERFMGVPYKFGSKTGNTSSFDCSSFTQTIYRMNGIAIPRTAGKQAQTGSHVARNNLQPGDLVFFYSPIHHVAIYIGNGKILHDYGKPGVTISNLNSGWWNNHYATARRVLPSNGQAFVAPQLPAVGQSANPSPKSGITTASILRKISIPSLANSPAKQHVPYQVVKAAHRLHYRSIRNREDS